MPVATKIKPIQGTFKRMIVVDLASALGLGVAASYAWWYGFHIPHVRKRDRFYAKLEEDRAAGIREEPRLPALDAEED